MPQHRSLLAPRTGPKSAPSRRVKIMLSGSESLPMRTCGLPRCPVQPQSRPIAISRERCALAIGAEEVSAVDLVRAVGPFVGDSVGDDAIGIALERGGIAHAERVEQPILFEQRFINHA